ncbi:hypothetical protein CAOG_01296 [Capsaspora owczarzaki ATCC 30864]|uniref:Histone RNA hairpin-binding protein RNA-binding domain-containing protein n=1 Tax=Capsaspora owczarzaki (strain ATCC 30864) TaxID=595528 RepID=A0A0D2VIS4_CAPO3|nr:hypothetical protein CAOG_01296 [Capsaspora owczarzaki ATCC 30864]KJE89887.1 hypothetical protein CAOG_001296 [Capsaspora owczarzaki ATCC 30864]|eukprot:XP_004349816.1 hypothetical protein CAOG_01296 [Capsaspora owczarzaki ATCC 30864]
MSQQGLLPNPPRTGLLGPGPDSTTASPAHQSHISSPALHSLQSSPGGSGGLLGTLPSPLLLGSRPGLLQPGQPASLMGAAPPMQMPMPVPVQATGSAYGSSGSLAEQFNLPAPGSLASQVRLPTWHEYSGLSPAPPGQSHHHGNRGGSSQGARTGSGLNRPPHRSSPSGDKANARVAPYKTPTGNTPAPKAPAKSSDNGAPQQPAYETDAHKLEQRQRQINLGKQKPEYARYIEAVPKDQRIRGVHPTTPDKFMTASKRQFDGLIKVWRRQLHRWDEPASATGASQPAEDGADSAEDNQNGNELEELDEYEAIAAMDDDISTYFEDM